MWQYEGDYTLYDLMQKKEWPYNLEPFLFGRELNLPKSPERRWLSLRTVMKQVLAWASIGPLRPAVADFHGASWLWLCCHIYAHLVGINLWWNMKQTLAVAAAQMCAAALLPA